MTTITLDKAKQELSNLIERALAGEDIVIALDNTPGVRLQPLQQANAEPAVCSYRGRGALKGQLTIGPEFFEALTDGECGYGDEPTP